MAEYEEKFIVINKKHIEEYIKCWKEKYDCSNLYREVPYARKLLNDIEMFAEEYEKYTGKPLDQKYYVVNQDEPYADNVIKMVLYHENKKELRDEQNIRR